MRYPSVHTWVSIIVVVAAAGLGACGGGAGSGEGAAGGGGFVQLLPLDSGLPGVPMFGVADGTSESRTPFNVASMGLRLTGANQTTPQTATQVGPNEFPMLAAGAHFLEFQFTSTLIASSVRSPMPNGNSGIVVQDALGNDVPYVITQTDQQIADDVAPAHLRLTFVDATGAPTPLSPGQYVLNVVTTSLLGTPITPGGAPRPFCLVPVGNDCNSQMTEISYSFTVGVDATPIDLAAQGASMPPNDPALVSPIAVNQEFIFRFTEAVDFQSLVGFNVVTNAPNVTARDPFMSIPFPVNNVAGTPPVTTAGENVTVLYAPPVGTMLCPQTYGFVVYMPDPFHNPREVRLRFVDLSRLTATDSSAMPQNYGLDRAVWQSAAIPAPTNSLGLTLSLPPLLPVPGSMPVGSANPGTATLAVNLLAVGNPLASDSSFTIDGVVGVTDRARNPITFGNVPNGTFNYVFRNGPLVANNPSPPDLTFITAGNRITSLSSGRLTTNSFPTGPLTGELRVAPNGVLDDTAIVGNALDIEFGQFLSPTNTIRNPPRPANPTMTNMIGGDAGIPTPAGGNPQTGLWNLLGGAVPSPICPLGVRLYVADAGESNRLKVFDSTTFQLIGAVSGVPNARGLAADPTLQFLYVSNGDQGTLQKIGIVPQTTSTFHVVVGTTPVGSQPGAVTIQPQNEDVLVANEGSNTVSFVDVPSFSERAQLPVGSGPRDIFATGRMLCLGCTLAYTAGITNFFDDSVSIYESDSTSNQVANGPNGRIFTSLGGFQGPQRGNWNRRTFITGTQSILDPGFLIANSTGSTVDSVNLVNFGLAPPPGIMGPPEFRTWSTVASFAASGSLGSPGDAKFDSLTMLNVTGPPIDNIVFPFDLNPRIVVVSYPAAGQVASFDFVTGSLFGTVSAPGSALYTTTDQ